MIKYFMLISILLMSGGMLASTSNDPIAARGEAGGRSPRSQSPGNQDFQHPGAAGAAAGYNRSNTQAEENPGYYYMPPQQPTNTNSQQAPAGQQAVPYNPV